MFVHFSEVTCKNQGAVFTESAHMETNKNKASHCGSFFRVLETLGLSNLDP